MAEDSLPVEVDVGAVAYRTGQKLQWDAANLKAVGCPDADRFLRFQRQTVRE